MSPEYSNKWDTKPTCHFQVWFEAISKLWGKFQHSYTNSGMIRLRHPKNWDNIENDNSIKYPNGNFYIDWYQQKAIIPWVIHPLFPFETIKWPNIDLEKLNQNLRFDLTNNNINHPWACSKRLNIPQNGGDRELLNLTDLHENQIKGFRRYIVWKSESFLNPPLFFTMKLKLICSVVSEICLSLSSHRVTWVCSLCLKTILFWYYIFRIMYTKSYV